ncbi:hypothetical protein FB45DRAFT_1060781 [Roridomyces roridus]|uniref:Uncharacterized protein n=1 Tax=Roridomyces roridus TaxID=1738132 RepID=A0AAD7BLI5_9AGAR|nr:hypothetical protein FB45DRAFT_1060781 [Roridomyces roridus]
MFICRIVSVFLLSAAALVSASPSPAPGAEVAIANRGAVDVKGVCNNLKSTTEAILPKIEDIAEHFRITAVTAVFLREIRHTAVLDTGRVKTTTRGHGTAPYPYYGAVFRELLIAEKISPLIKELTFALDTAAAASAGLPLAAAAEKEVIALLVAGVLTDISKTLDGLLFKALFIPNIWILLAEVDASINGFLIKVDIVVVGVVELISGFVIGVEGLLKGLAFKLTCGKLGL